MPPGQWACMDCGNRAAFQVVHYDVSRLDQTGDGPTYSGGRSGEDVNANSILQVVCEACQSARVGWAYRADDGQDVQVPGRWVRNADAASEGLPPLGDSVEEIALSLGVPEQTGSDGSLQWDVENLVAGTRILVGFIQERRTASVYVRRENAFVGYTALEPVTSILNDLDEGEVQFISDYGGQRMRMSVTAEGVFFLRAETSG